MGLLARLKAWLSRPGGPGEEEAPAAPRSPEEAARRRIAQVRRSLGQAPLDGGIEPPWARERRTNAPPRPLDNFFALTVLLSRALPPDPEALRGLLRGPALPAPEVRLIPLSRRQQQEEERGYSAEVKEGGRRAFLLFRPVPFPIDGAPPAPCHVGLFVSWGKGKGGRGPGPGAAEARLLVDLLRALLPAATGLLVNRAGLGLLPLLPALAAIEDLAVPVFLWQQEGRTYRRVERAELSGSAGAIVAPCPEP